MTRFAAVVAFTSASVPCDGAEKPSQRNCESASRVLETRRVSSASTSARSASASVRVRILNVSVPTATSQRSLLLGTPERLTLTFSQLIVPTLAASGTPLKVTSAEGAKVTANGSRRPTVRMFFETPVRSI